MPLIAFWLNPLRIAFSFLTLVPASRGLNLSQRDISNSRAFYPAVGLLLGLLLVGVEEGASRAFPIHLTAALLLAVTVAFTRALHLDGLMDVCDGLFGGYTPERRLEIMKDSHVGAFGVAGGVTVLILKYGALVSLLGLEGPGKEWALLLFPALSRWAMVVALGAFPYARDNGLGSPFHRTTQGGQGGQSGAKLATMTAALTAVAAGFLLGGFAGLGLAAGVTLLAAGLGWAMSKSLGGLTGDTYGAINEISEVAVLAAAVILASHKWLEPLPELLGRF